MEEVKTRTRRALPTPIIETLLSPTSDDDDHDAWNDSSELVFSCDEENVETEMNDNIRSSDSMEIIKEDMERLNEDMNTSEVADEVEAMVEAVEALLSDEGEDTDGWGDDDSHLFSDNEDVVENGEKKEKGEAAGRLLENVAVLETSLVSESSPQVITEPMGETAQVTEAELPVTETAPMFENPSVAAPIFKTPPVAEAAPMFETSPVNETSSMFANTSVAEEAPMFETSPVNEVASMFENTSVSEEALFQRPSVAEATPMFKTPPVTETSSMFQAPPVMETAEAASMFETAAVTENSIGFEAPPLNDATSLFNDHVLIPEQQVELKESSVVETPSVPGVPKVIEETQVQFENTQGMESARSFTDENTFDTQESWPPSQLFASQSSFDEEAEHPHKAAESHSSFGHFPAAQVECTFDTEVVEEAEAPPPSGASTVEEHVPEPVVEALSEIPFSSATEEKPSLFSGTPAFLDSPTSEPAPLAFVSATDASPPTGSYFDTSSPQEQFPAAPQVHSQDSNEFPSSVPVDTAIEDTFPEEEVVNAPLSTFESHLNAAKNDEGMASPFETSSPAESFPPANSFFQSTPSVAEAPMSTQPELKERVSFSMHHEDETPPPTVSGLFDSPPRNASYEQEEVLSPPPTVSGLFGSPPQSQDRSVFPTSGNAFANATPETIDGHPAPLSFKDDLAETDAYAEEMPKLSFETLDRVNRVRGYNHQDSTTKANSSAASIQSIHSSECDEQSETSSYVDRMSTTTYPASVNEENDSVQDLGSLVNEETGSGHDNGSSVNDETESGQENESSMHDEDKSSVHDDNASSVHDDNASSEQTADSLFGGNSIEASLFPARSSPEVPVRSTVKIHVPEVATGDFFSNVQDHQVFSPTVSASHDFDFEPPTSKQDRSEETTNDSAEGLFSSVPDNAFGQSSGNAFETQATNGYSEPVQNNVYASSPTGGFGASEQFPSSTTYPAQNTYGGNDGYTSQQGVYNTAPQDAYNTAPQDAYNTAPQVAYNATPASTSFGYGAAAPAVPSYVSNSYAAPRTPTMPSYPAASAPRSFVPPSQLGNFASPSYPTGQEAPLYQNDAPESFVLSPHLLQESVQPSFQQTSVHQEIHVPPSSSGVDMPTIYSPQTANSFRDPGRRPFGPCVSFGIGGKLIVMRPLKKEMLNVAGTQRGSLGSSSSKDQSAEKKGLRKGPILIHQLNLQVPRDTQYTQMKSFPGPLLGSSVSPEAIYAYIDTQLATLAACTDTTSEDAYVLWSLMKLFVQYNGMLRSEEGMTNVNSPEAAIVKLLNESEARRIAAKEPRYAPTPHEMPAPQSAEDTEKAVANFEIALHSGDLRKALKIAMDANITPLAMLVSSYMGQQAYTEVATTVVHQYFGTGSPALSLCLSFAGQELQSVRDSSDPSPILSNWVNHVTMLLAYTTTTTNKILRELGDRLWNEKGLAFAAHICYIIAGVPVATPSPNTRISLIGGNHRDCKEKHYSPTPVQMTEIYEWVTKKDTFSNSTIWFQACKYFYAMYLADVGLVDTAHRYVHCLASDLQSICEVFDLAASTTDDSNYLKWLCEQVQVFEDRLRTNLGKAPVEHPPATTAASEKKTGFLDRMLNRGTDNKSEEIKRVNKKVPPGISTDCPPPLSCTGIPPLPISMAPLSPKRGPMSPPGHTNAQAQQWSEHAAQGSQSIEPPAQQQQVHHTEPLQQWNNDQTRPPQLHNDQPQAPQLHNDQQPAQQWNNGQQPAQQWNNGQQPAQQWNSGQQQGQQWNNGQQPAQQWNNGAPQPPQWDASLHAQVTESVAKALPPQMAMAKPSFKRLTSSDKVDSAPSSYRANSGPNPDVSRSSLSKAASLGKEIRSKTPPASMGKTNHGPGWFSGIGDYIAQKMNPDAKVAKMGTKMDAYYDKEKKKWVFPGEDPSEEKAAPAAPPTDMSMGAPGSAPTGPTPPAADDPLAALMAPPASRLPSALSSMMAPPPSRLGQARSGARNKPPRPQYTTFKPPS